jgi:hypothetical protein
MPEFITVANEVKIGNALAAGAGVVAVPLPTGVQRYELPLPKHE